MRWRRTDAVEDVDALLLTGLHAAERMRSAIARRAALYGALRLAMGEDWAAVFAAPMAEESEAVLPHVTGAIALYRALPGWWFPVGAAPAAPFEVHGELLAALAAREAIATPAIAVPDADGALDLYHARHIARVDTLAWA